MPDVPSPIQANSAVFLSYAREDTAATLRIAEALRAAGVEVWFDQSELRGGDAWDQKIRTQIKECALFLPVISANTQSRHEGYFRLEWRLADQRTHLMGKSRAFLVPVCIDATRDGDADVPDSFLAVQWMRLANGEANATFCERVKTLLSPSPMETGRPRPVQRDEGVASPAPAKVGRRVPAAAWIAVAVVALVSVVWFASRRNEPPVSSNAGAVTHPPATEKSAAPQTEAQKLVAQARQVYEGGDEINRENLYLADDLVQRAMNLDPAEASAWEFGAWLSYIMVWHGFDDSEAQRETMMRRAARARALAPASVTAQTVEITARLSAVFVGSDRRVVAVSDIEGELLALLKRAPGDWLVHRALATTYRFMRRPDDAVREYQRAIELSGGKPMAVCDLINFDIRSDRFADAEKVLTDALARESTARLLTFDVILKTRWRGDTAGAMRTVDQWPSWLVRQDRSIAIGWLAALWARDSGRALGIVRQARSDYVRDTNFSGPRAVLSARAYEVAGNTESAQADWRKVIQRCDQDVAANPQDVTALCWKSWAQARLGDQAGAQGTATMLRQRLASAVTSYFSVMSLAQLWATVGWTDLAIEELGREMQTVDRFTTTRAYLELEPAFDPLRNDPRFQALVAKASAPAVSVASPAPADKSIAVLAFANFGGDKENEYFSDGITEELLNVLAKVPGLRVAARTSAFYFKDKNVPIPEIAQKLNVAYVVEGSVQKSGTRVKITAQLIKAADGFHVWSDTFTRELKDVFAMQDEIAGLIAKQLQLTLGDAPRVAKTVDPEAHRLVLEGVHYWNLRTDDGFTRAEAAFRKAIELAPDFAQAHAGLANVIGTRFAYQAYAGLVAQSVEPQRAAAQRALALSPALAEGYAALSQSYFIEGRLAEAAQEFRKGLALNPNSALLHHWYSLVLEVDGRLDEALAEIGRATQLDPLSGIALLTRERMLTAAGKYSEALELHERVVGLLPGNETTFGFQALNLLALNRRDEALATVRKLAATPTMNRRITVDAQAIYVLRQTGHAAEVAEHAKRILPLFSPDSYQRGAVLAAQDRWDEAMPFLERTPVILRYVFYWDPMWDEWRDDPRFQQLLVKLGCAEDYKVARATLARMLKEQGAKK